MFSAAPHSFGPAAAPIQNGLRSASPKKSTLCGSDGTGTNSVASSSDSTSTAPSTWQPVSHTKSLSARNSWNVSLDRTCARPAASAIRLPGSAAASLARWA